MRATPPKAPPLTWLAAAPALSAHTRGAPASFVAWPRRGVSPALQTPAGGWTSRLGTPPPAETAWPGALSHQQRPEGGRESSSGRLLLLGQRPATPGPRPPHPDSARPPRPLPQGRSPMSGESGTRLGHTQGSLPQPLHPPTPSAPRAGRPGRDAACWEGGGGSATALTSGLKMLSKALCPGPQRRRAKGPPSRAGHPPSPTPSTGTGWQTQPQIPPEPGCCLFLRPLACIGGGP